MDEQNPDNIPVLYSNSMRLGLTFTDIKLFFGEIVPPPPPDNLTIGQTVPMGAGKHVNRVCIILSPDILPALADGLSRAAQAYQAQYGPLRKVPQIPQVAASTEVEKPEKK